jgi:hypothetical protein
MRDRRKQKDNLVCKVVMLGMRSRLDEYADIDSLPNSVSIASLSI